MVHYPDVQRKARQELDTVVGRDRLPGPDDEVHLPYVTARGQCLPRLVPGGMGGRWARGTPRELPGVRMR